MSEFRQNPITKDWVLIAPSRGKKPDQYKTYSVMHGIPEADSNCLFCPGKEVLNEEIVHYNKEGFVQHGRPSSTDWEIRVIKNKFASLDHTKIYRHKEFYISRSGDGDHEVVINRGHNESIALQSITTVELTLKVFIDRIKALSAHKELSYVQIFHNHGRDAGASIIHPHHQIIASPIIPPKIHSEILSGYHYFQNHKTCIYCDIIKEEREVKDRVVYESEHFIVLSPYASESPFETWIMPKRHSARFEDMTEEEVNHLSFVLKVSLGQLYAKLSDPPLNSYIQNMPLKKAEGEHSHSAHEEKSFHWRLTVFPRITIWAGFEIATGVPVNPISPEVATRFLKGE